MILVLPKAANKVIDAAVTMELSNSHRNSNIALRPFTLNPAAVPGGLKMMGTYTILEILLAAAVFLLASTELRGVIRARREGRSTNVSRLISHTAMLVLLLAYVAFAWSYLPLEATAGGIDKFNTPTFNWTFLIPGVIVAILAAWESLSIYRARRAGITDNTSRLLTHSVMVLVLVVMMGLSVRKWDRYLQRMEATYAQSIPQPLVP